MVRRKQVNTENGAVLNRDFPRQGRSLIIGAEELRRLFPNVKPEYIGLAIKRFGDYRFGDEEKEIFEKFTECTNEMYGIAEREAFVRGFTLGARIIIEVMTAEE